MVHPRPQTPQGKSITTTGTPMLILLSFVGKFDTKVFHGDLFSPLFEKSVDTNIL